MRNIEIIQKLNTMHTACESELLQLITTYDEKDFEYLRKCARDTANRIFGNKIYIRGLIEFSSICKNDCFYCGLRRSNGNAVRYRLTKDEILSCCQNGHKLGFRTFVLQGGEDGFFTDDVMCDIVSEIKNRFPDCAVTLSLGERSYESYQRLFDSGADRYLLRHETADKKHYSMLHPPEMSLENRMQCLYNLKRIGYQTGAGFMVGSPFQTHDNLAEDLLFIKKLEPEMVGIGPFISHNETPFKDFKNGTLRDTLVMVALTRILLPHALIPSTTALGTINPKGRELGLKAGANVVMPNLSPIKFRKLYSLYDNKICMGDEAAECRKCLERRVESAGYKIVTDRGDWRA